MKHTLLVLLFLSFTAPGFGGAVDNKINEPYKQEIEKWRQERVTSLKSNWLTVVGLFWLKEGENTFGSDESNAIVFPKGKTPASAGSFFLEKGKVRVSTKEGSGIMSDGKPVTSLALQPDVPGPQTVLTLGGLSFYVIKRGDRLAIRLKDKDSEALKKFAGLQYYPIEPKWRVAAKWVPYNPPKKIQILNVIGMLEDNDCGGAVEFAIDGKNYRIDALEEGEGDERVLFLIFGDQTNGKETYGAGRFLYSDAPDTAGKVIVDFNEAYSPPCAFTAFATCPLPPKQNKLPLRIDAGEKKYH